MTETKTISLPNSSKIRKRRAELQVLIPTIGKARAPVTLLAKHAADLMLDLALLYERTDHPFRERAVEMWEELEARSTD